MRSVAAVLFGQAVGGQYPPNESSTDGEPPLGERLSACIPLASGLPAHRLTDEAEGAALLREPCRLDRASRRAEVKGAQWEERGDAAKATSAGRGEPACAQGGDVMCAVVPGHDAWTRRAGAVEDCDRLLGKEAGRECGLWQPFFLDRP